MRCRRCGLLTADCGLPTGYNASMIYTYEAAKREALEATRRAAGAEVGLSLSIPPAGVAADLAIPCFPLAAALRTAPQEIATRLAGGLKLGPRLQAAPGRGGDPH